MKRLIAGLLMFIASTAVFAQGAPVAGKEFKPLNPPQPVSGNQVEVLEFFSYACSHCDAFEPILNSWLSSKPKDVTFRHVPAIFNKRIGTEPGSAPGFLRRRRTGPGRQAR